jgi:hypothetical protein
MHGVSDRAGGTVGSVSSSPSRGASGPAAVVMTLALGLCGGLFDVFTGPGLRLVFAACFVTGCVLSALLVRRRDLGTAAVMPPLVYVGVALVIGAVHGTSSNGSFVVRHGLELFTQLVLGAPALLLATALSLAITLVRGLGRRDRPVASRRQERDRSLVS